MNDHVAVDGAAGSEIDKAALPRDIFNRCDSYGYRAVAEHYLPLLVLVALAPILWSEVSPWGTLLLLPFLGAVAYKLTILMHDCAHYSLFTSRTANRLTGLVTGFVLASDFRTFSANHWAHHNRFGEEDDPQGPDYLGLHGASQREILIHLFRPLVGYNLFKLGKFAPAPPDGEPLADRTEQGSSGGSWAFLAGTGLTQLVIATAITAGWSYPLLALLFPVSAATFGLFYSQVRGFCEHVALEDEDEFGKVRTHLPSAFDRLFFYSLNFNYHVEHHLLPSVPSYQLPKLHSLVREQVHTDRTISPSIFSTIRSRLDSCPK